MDGTWVALLRGVNVGGGNKVPMAELRSLAGDLGWQDARTYIASGNLVFRAAGAADDLSRRLRRAMAERMGVEVPVLVLPAATVAAALAACPFAPAEGNRCHVLFLWASPQVDWAACAAFGTAGEELVVADRIAWLHTPEGFGRSTLAENLGKVIRGTEITARNLNTLRRLVEMSA